MTEKFEMKNEELKRMTTSPVWSYFKVCEDNAVMADCLLCGVRMSRGGTAPNRCGTTNLRRHVLYTHNITLPSAKGRNSTTGDSLRKVSKRKQVKKMPSTLKKNATRKKTANQEVKKASPKEPKGKIKEDGETSPPLSEPVMCIRWNTYLSNMTSALPHLLQDEQFVDVTLACEGQSLKCHKILLAACSPYFYELLASASCRHPIIMFKDYHFWELQALVAFMYCGEVNVPQSQLPRILRVAEALQIKGLAKPASKSDCPSDNELEPAQETDHSHHEPPAAIPPAGSKRKRKPSSHNCCKSSPNSKHKTPACPLRDVKNKSKLKPAKRKTPAKKLKLARTKKTPPKKIVAKESPNDQVPYHFSNPLGQHLPELLTGDMLTDILAMKDLAGITEGISLPEANKVGSVDGVFPLEELEGMKITAMDDDEPEIGSFLANGLNHTDNFDLLPHISPECKLDEDDGR